MPTLAYAVLDDAGRVVARFATKGGALRSAVRRQASTLASTFSVVWCDDQGTTKVWLAYATEAGVHKTPYWAD